LATYGFGRLEEVTDDEKGRLLTTAELAAILQLSPSTLANWRSLGQGPPYRKTGGAVRYRWADVEAWSLERVRNLVGDAARKGVRGEKLRG
jgi:predicted DNA-binding transcriptional regulator AlpA